MRYATLKARAAQSRRGLQPRAGERSEAAGGAKREASMKLQSEKLQAPTYVHIAHRALLRTIPPPAPVLPREIANLACFAHAPLVRLCEIRGKRQ